MCRGPKGLVDSGLDWCTLVNRLVAPRAETAKRRYKLFAVAEKSHRPWSSAIEDRGQVFATNVLTTENSVMYSVSKYSEYNFVPSKHQKILPNHSDSRHIRGAKLIEELKKLMLSTGPRSNIDTGWTRG